MSFSSITSSLKLKTHSQLIACFKYVFDLLFTPEQLPGYFASEYHLQGTTFVSFSSVTTLKLKTHSQLTQSPIACFNLLAVLLQTRNMSGCPFCRPTEAFVL